MPRTLHIKSLPSPFISLKASTGKVTGKNRKKCLAMNYIQKTRDRQGEQKEYIQNNPKIENLTRSVVWK